MTDTTPAVRIVPVEPTKEMLDAAFDAFEIDQPKQYADGTAARTAIWSAMLAAAPVAPGGEGEYLNPGDLFWGVCRAGLIAANAVAVLRTNPEKAGLVIDALDGLKREMDSVVNAPSSDLAALRARSEPEAGAVEPGKWSQARNLFVTYAEKFTSSTRYEEASDIADKAAREFDALYAHPAPSDPSATERMKVAAKDALAWMARAHDRIHCLPRNTDTALASGIDTSISRLRQALAALGEA